MTEIARASPRLPGARALLIESQALMRRLFAPEENHFLSLEALEGPAIRFFVAREGEAVLGTAALALEDGYGEIKSMYVAEVARRRRIGALLLQRLEAEARARGLALLRLETGDRLAAARGLYARAGFVERGPFGGYVANGTSIFMEKALA